METALIHPPSSILHPRRILVRGTNWLGDAVMTTPALLRLREKFPDVHIALLTPEKLRELWTNHPAVDETISFAAGENVFAVGKKLRAGKFDVALVLPNSPRSAIETWLAGIPQRTGYARPWRNFFLTQAIAPRADAVKMRKLSIAEIKSLIVNYPEARIRVPESRKQPHQIHEYLHLASALGANSKAQLPKLFTTSEEIEAVKKHFGLEKMGGPVFGLNPGAEYGAAKRWPVEKFIAAAKELNRRTNCAWILFGGKGDVEIANQIVSQLQSANSNLLNLTGKTSLRELMALLKLCRVLLTNDTGPMHVAAALGTPVAVLFGSTASELTGPISSGELRHPILESHAPCSPCFLRACPIDFRCMNGISVERVVEAVLSCSGAL